MDKMIQFASLEQNVMFPATLAELGCHGNQAAVSLSVSVSVSSRLLFIRGGGGWGGTLRSLILYSTGL